MTTLSLAQRSPYAGQRMGNRFRTPSSAATAAITATTQSPPETIQQKLPPTESTITSTSKIEPSTIQPINSVLPSIPSRSIFPKNRFSMPQRPVVTAKAAVHLADSEQSHHRLSHPNFNNHYNDYDYGFDRHFHRSPPHHNHDYFF